MYPRFELRILREEDDRQSDRLQYRSVIDENETFIASTHWQDVPIHIKKKDGTVVDYATNKPV